MSEATQNAKFMYDAVLAAYCMDLDVYLKMMGARDPSRAFVEYNREKWQMQQKDFTKWYCQLDSGNQERFAAYVMDQVRR